MENENPTQQRSITKRVTSFFTNIIPQRVWVITLILIIVGFLLIEHGTKQTDTAWGHAWIIFGTVLCVECVFFLLHHYVLKFADESNIKAMIENSLIPKDNQLLDKFCSEVENIVSKNVESLNNFKTLGLTNIHSGFDKRKFFFGVKRYGQTTIILQRISFSNDEFSFIKENIKDLIRENDSTLKILLFSPLEENALRRRLSQFSPVDLEMEIHVLQKTMELHLKELYMIHDKLPTEKKENLQVRVHHDFIPAALSGFGDIIFCGTYLRNRMAEDGVQFVARGKGTDLYKELISHFDRQFEDAVTYRFESNEYQENPQDIIMDL